MVQFFFPSLHEALIIISREFGHEVVTSGTKAGVAVSNVRKRSIAVFGELDLQPTSRHRRNDLQHLDKPSGRLMARDIPNRLAELVRRDENAIALGDARETDDEIWYPAVRPFRFSHRTQKRKDF